MDLKVKVLIDDKYEEVEFILLNKDWILVGVIVTPLHNNRVIIDHYAEKIIDYKHQILGCHLSL